MGKNLRYQDRQYQEAPPTSWTPFSSSSSLVNTTLPPITSLTRSTGSGRTSFASSSSSYSASAASLSHSVSSDSLSIRSSPLLNEPRSPYEGQPLLASRRFIGATTSSAMSHVQHPASADAHVHPYHQDAPSRHTRTVEDGSHLWGDGMKGIWNSLTGAPHGKPRSQPLATSIKGEHLEPARPADVEAATSIWDIPRETVTMTMGFQGSYEDHSC
ncbi:hypothetical protein [Sporisorium scitamineum]|uniref:Uncharacterized protein n=1 Tax=Sporisorium scitamineum TaxID=49012 RepID=A0A0F7RVW6_9BASI|nr:hypothetical protein [Sporisorium scitamineum]